MAHRILSSARKFEKAFLCGIKTNNINTIKVNCLSRFTSEIFAICSIFVNKISQLFQQKHDLVLSLSNKNSLLASFETFLNQWKSVCFVQAKPPKGFEKYYEKQQQKEASKSDKEPSSSDPQEPAAKEASSETPTSKPPGAKDPSKPQNDWNFGMFGPNPPAQRQGSGNQGQGRPIGPEGNPDQTRLIVFGALGAFCVVAALTFFEMGYKEISWKEFVNK
jgi:hypothetical protein